MSYYEEKPVQSIALMKCKELASKLVDSGIPAHMEYDDEHYIRVSDIPCVIALYKGIQLDIKWIIDKYTCRCQELFGSRQHYWKYPDSVVASITKY